MMTIFTRGGASALVLASVVGFADVAIAQDATIKVGGRLMLDYLTADVKSPDVSVETTAVRRARLAASGKYGDAVSYKFEVNYTTGSDLELTDGFIKFQPKGQKTFIKIGQYKTHNSLEEETSSRYTTTIERGSYTDTFELNRRLGVSVGTSGDNFTAIAGVFSESVDGGAFENNGNAIAARATYLPYQDDDTLVHIGASWRYRNAADAIDPSVNDGLRYRQRPYANQFSSDNTGGILSSGRIVATPRFAKSDNFYAAEGLVIHRNLWAAGEYALTEANGSAGNADASFGGGYLEAGIMFGGKRTYAKSTGRFNAPKVDNPIGSGGYGAFSLVARYDIIDLQDGPYVGKMDSVILGADWHPTKQSRLRLNYFDSNATNGAAESASGFLARLGFNF